MQWWRLALAALALWAVVARAEVAAQVGGGAGASTGTSGPASHLLAVAQARKAAHISPRHSAIARAHIPEAMRALYAQLAAQEALPVAFLPRSPLQLRTANTVRSFSHQESNIDRRFKDEKRVRLAFNVTVPDGESLRGADLVLARDSIRTLSSDHKHKVLVYDIMKPGRRGDSKPVLKLLDSKWVKLVQGGDVKLDVTSAVERWLWQPEDNHGLLVHIHAPEDLKKHRHVRLRRAVGEKEKSWKIRQPALLAYTDDGRARLQNTQAAPHPAPARPRRGTRKQHRRKDGREACQRRPLFVDFADVGWSDWIVAPNGYDAFYCHGDCPFPLPDHLNSTNHAIVQTLVNSVNPAAVPKACCVPTALSSISMLYLDEENKVVLKNYQEMAVVGCGCR